MNKNILARIQINFYKRYRDSQRHCTADHSRGKQSGSNCLPSSRMKGENRGPGRRGGKGERVRRFAETSGGDGGRASPPTRRAPAARLLPRRCITKYRVAERAGPASRALYIVILNNDLGSGRGRCFFGGDGPGQERDSFRPLQTSEDTWSAARLPSENGSNFDFSMGYG